MNKPTPQFPLMFSFLTWTEWELEKTDEGLFAVVFPRNTDNETIIRFMGEGKILAPIDEFSQHMFVGSSYRKIEEKLEEVFQKAKGKVLWNNQNADFKSCLIRITDGEGKTIGDIQTIRGLCQYFSDFL